MSEPAEWLDLLEVPESEVGPAQLDRLFRAFVEKVPFESASKILRAASLAGPEHGPSDAGEFWDGFRDRGTGGTCFSRTNAFAVLLRASGFAPTIRLGSVGGGAPRGHAALRVASGGTTWLVDVGFPLSALVEWGERERETAHGRLVLSEGGQRLEFPGTAMAAAPILFEEADVSEAEFRQAWVRSFAEPTIFSESVVLRRQDGHRILRFMDGEIAILDAHSRTRIPLAGKRAGRLAEIFRIDGDVVSGALALAGDPDSPLTGALMEVFLETPRAREILEQLATDAGYRLFVSGLGHASVSQDGEGLRAEIRGPAEGRVVERIQRRGESLVITREGSPGATGFRVEEAGGRPHLVRFAEFPDAREEFLRVDAGRGRWAGVLAMDLAAAERALAAC